MNIKNLMQAIQFKIFPKKIGIRSYRLLGREIFALKGTVRNKVDQDDAWFYYLAKNSKLIFDVGANTGYTAILALIDDIAKRIILIDANPEALSDAAKNLFINNLGQNCSFFTGFVGSSISSTIKFYTVGNGAAGSMYSSHATTAAQLNESIQVASTTLDYLVDFYGCIPDFVKIDIEGAEVMALNGGFLLAAKAKTRFLVEMHSPDELPMKQNATLVLEWCNENGYTPWYLKEEKILESAEIIAHRGKCHLLLQPNGWKFPEFLTGIKQRAPLPELI